MAVHGEWLILLFQDMFTWLTRTLSFSVEDLILEILRTQSQSAIPLSGAILAMRCALAVVQRCVVAKCFSKYQCVACRMQA